MSRRSCSSRNGLRALIVADAQLGEHIMRALILRRLGLIEKGLGPIIVGNGDDARLVRLQGFLRRNAYPAMVIDARSDPEAITLLGGMTTGPDDFPLVFCPNGYVLRAPDEAQLASCLGLVPTFEQSHIYDVAIVGAGPAGLAAFVYAATEGLSGRGFRPARPRRAGRRQLADRKLSGFSHRHFGPGTRRPGISAGAEIRCPSGHSRQGQGREPSGPHFSADAFDGQRISARTVVVASGAAYRRPTVPGFEGFEGRGTYYWASTIEAKLVKGQDIVLIGGGNSAGQAVVFLANFARSIRVLIRGKGLGASMSKYLIDRIGSLPNVTLCTSCTLRSLDGDEAGITHLHVRHEDDNEGRSGGVASSVPLYRRGPKDGLARLERRRARQPGFCRDRVRTQRAWTV